MYEIHQVKVHVFGDPKMFTSSLTVVNILGSKNMGTVGTNEVQSYLYPRSLTVVNILGSQKCALSLDVPLTGSIIGLTTTP